MSITNKPRRKEYTAIASQTSFAYDFRIFADTDLAVYKDTVLLIYGDDYTVTGADEAGGGNVVLVTACVGGESVVIIGSMEMEQPSSLPGSGPFPSATVERGLDRAVIYAQELDERVDHSILMPISATGTGQLVDAPAEGTVLGWAGGVLRNLSAGTAELGADLLSEGLAKGDALVTTKQPLTGAVARSQHAVNCERISVKDFGATGDGVTDDAAAIQAANDAAAAEGAILFIPVATYYIGSTVEFTTHLDGRGATITTDANITAVRLGHDTDTFERKIVFLPDVLHSVHDWTGSSVGVELRNAWACEVHINYIYGFVTGFKMTANGTTGCAYNEVHVGTLETNKVNLYILPLAETAWPNENNIYGGRYVHDSALAAATQRTVIYASGSTGADMTSTAGLEADMVIMSTGVTPGTTIASVESGTHIHLSANAIATGALTTDFPVIGARQILMSTYNDAATGRPSNHFYAPCIEGNVAEYAVELIACAWVEIYNARWEMTVPMLKLTDTSGAYCDYIRVDGGYNIESLVIVADPNTEHVITITGNGVRAHVNHAHGAFIGSTSSSPNDPVVTVLPSTAGAAAERALVPDTDYAVAFSENHSRFKATADTLARFQIWNTTGAIGWGDGTNALDVTLERSDDATLALGAGQILDLKAGPGYLKLPVIATASLPAKGATSDGLAVIEFQGADNYNLIIYGGGEMFRIDGGTKL